MRARLFGWTVSWSGEGEDEEEEEDEEAAMEVPCMPAYRCFMVLLGSSTCSEGGLVEGVEDVKAVIAVELPYEPGMIHGSE